MARPSATHRVRRLSAVLSGAARAAAVSSFRQDKNGHLRAGGCIGLIKSHPTGARNVPPIAVASQRALPIAGSPLETNSGRDWKLGDDHVRGS